MRGAAVLAVAAATSLTTVIAPDAIAQSDPRASTLVAARPSSETMPIVIGHRGASGYRPEHTLASWRLAIQMGADYVEPDLVSTKDGVLVARHENEISGTTDVADHPEFADRYTTKVIDGRSISGWFTEDFTLAELKTLRAVERLPDVRPDNTRYNGRFEVPTFDEFLAMVKRESRERGVKIGIYPETKHPSYFDSIGLSLEEPLVAALQKHGLNGPRSKVIIQSFETANLRELDTMTNVPLAQLVDASGRPYDFVESGDPRTYADLVTPEGLAWISTYADGIGANKNVIIPRDAEGYLTEPTDVVDDAHAVGLIVHIWTIRDENQFLPKDFWIGTDPNAKGDSIAEVQTFLDAGVDGVFADQPDTAVYARDAWLADQTLKAS